ncbi:MAG: hypothetical protein ACR2QC_01460 [Gammaproteobacteria bacterium]
MLLVIGCATDDSIYDASMLHPGRRVMAATLPDVAATEIVTTDNLVYDLEYENIARIDHIRRGEFELTLDTGEVINVYDYNSWRARFLPALKGRSFLAQT